MYLSFDEIRSSLRDWRDSNVRCSKKVVQCGEFLFKKDLMSSFNDEVWLVYEQILIASLDTQRFDMAQQCLVKLSNNFPESNRIKKLAGLKLEAQGYYQKALEVYDEIIEKDPTNAAARKRKVVVLKSQGKNVEAIKELTVYLHTFMSDQDAWLELSELYLKELDYNKAAFCLEELLLSKPFNHLFHQRLAEIRYSQGGTENIELARQYFAQAVKISGNTNIRALYGLLLSSASLSSSKPSAKNSNPKYAVWAAKMVKTKYRQTWDYSHNSDNKHIPKDDFPSLTASVDKMLEEMHI